jgi:hypothetical protein
MPLSEQVYFDALPAAHVVAWQEEQRMRAIMRRCQANVQRERRSKAR